LPSPRRVTRSVVTHLFRRGDEYLESDAVYGVKEPLIVDFVEKPAGNAPSGEVLDKPFYEVRYDFVLQKEEKKAKAA
jgi:hydroxyquinol 1,2-dioxygenase